MLNEIEHIPEGLLEVDAKNLHQILPGPTLLHLPGRRSQPLFVSLLLHGNEDVGLKAVQALLNKYANKELPRAISLFFGNILAARQGVRRLEDQPDFNRVWPGHRLEDSAEARMMQQIMEIMANKQVFMSVDLHNNTGLNPYYACINKMDNEFLQLGALFGRTVVYTVKPEGIQSMAFSQLCPAVTLECGKVGDDFGTSKALEFVEACLDIHHISDHAVRPRDVDLFHTVAIVKIAADKNFSFNHQAADLMFEPQLDHLNFQELAVGSVFCRVASLTNSGLEVWNESGEEVSSQYFERDGEELRLKKAIMPAMLTLNSQIIRQDCLCYFMQRMEQAPIQQNTRSQS